LVPGGRRAGREPGGQEGTKMSWGRVVALGLALCGGVAACAPTSVSLGPSGGFNGNAFDDRRDPSGTPSPSDRLVEVHYHNSRVILGLPRTTDIVHWVQNTYVEPDGTIVRGPKRGGGAEGCCEFNPEPPPVTLSGSDRLVGICGRAAEFVDRLVFAVNQFDANACVSITRGSGGNPFFLPAPPGYAVTGFHGRSGAAVDAIGITAAPDPAATAAPLVEYPIGAAGGWGGEAFADPAAPVGSRVAQVVVQESCFVASIQLVYAPSGATETHGTGSGFCPGTGGWIVAPQAFQMADDEFIVGIRGNAGRVIDRMVINTNKRTLGPFGASDGGNPFTLTAPDGYAVRRLFGRSGDFLDAIGIVAERRFPPNQ
jgi:hypothetical protein